MNLPPSLMVFEALIESLSPIGRASFRQRVGSRRKGGATLRAGIGTPLWNRLVTEAMPFLKKRGEKAQLSRLLGAHRQAINEYFVSRTRMPDAERTLLLVEWIQARKSGKPVKN